MFGKRKLPQFVFALGVFAALGSVPGTAAVVDVTPTSMGNWAFDNRDVNGNVGAEPTASGGIVPGPASPPLGTGSANLAVGNGATGGDGSAELRNTGYAGVALSTITALSYSTYTTANNGQQFPYLGLMVNNSGASAGVDNILFFEPPYQQPTTGGPTLPDQGATAMNTWQTWNALTGGWWDNNGTLGFGGLGGVGTLADYLTLFPLATIVNADGTGLGGVRFNVGFASAGDQFNGYVDNFTINNTTYNFDPAAAAVPVPATLPLFATGLAGLGWLARRRKIRVIAAA